MDNEYAQTPEGAAYFQALVDAFKDSPIVVPLTYNDPHAGENFINGTVSRLCYLDCVRHRLNYMLQGAVDIYGLDAYPQRFDCSNPDKWNPVDDTYHEYHMREAPASRARTRAHIHLQASTPANRGTCRSSKPAPTILTDLMLRVMRSVASSPMLASKGESSAGVPS